MKYTVMECHEGYAVLMGEDSCFVRAANMHYSVGQIVTSPIILDDDVKRSAISRSVFVKIAAAAACITLISAVGLNYYSKNLKTHSVLTIGSDFNIQLELNSKGKVIRMKSQTADGKDVLEHYDTKDKNMVGAVNDILDVMKEQGYITNDDTVELYISADSKKESESYKNEIEHEISAQKVNVSVVDKPPEPPQKRPVVHEPADMKKEDEKIENEKTEKLPVPSASAPDVNKNPEIIPVPSEPVIDKNEIIENIPVIPHENIQKPENNSPQQTPPLPENIPEIEEIVPPVQTPPENIIEQERPVRPEPSPENQKPPYENKFPDNSTPEPRPHRDDFRNEYPNERTKE